MNEDTSEERLARADRVPWEHGNQVIRQIENQISL